MYIDTHTHLYANQFDADRDSAIARARQAGVEKFILPAIDTESFDAMMALAGEYPDVCYPTIGLHPTSVNAGNYEAELEFVKNNIDKKHKFVAIGEIGIDCYWTLDYIEQQRYVFEQQLIMAAERDLPVIIHARESFCEIFAVLDKLSLDVRGVFHSFSGTYADYEKIKSYGKFKIGIGGIVTFKNGGIADIVKNMTLDEIMLETDSPYLAPAPYRGKRNESTYIPLIAEKIAEIKNIDINAVAQYTSNNAQKLFFKM